VRLYIVRHGESGGNVGRWHQKHDTSLSETGRKQARVLAERATRIPVEIILSSSYIRARETAEIIAAAAKNLRVEVTDVLREFKRPSEIVGKNIHDPDVTRIKALVSEHFGDEQWHYSDEENFFDLRERATSFLSEVSKRPEKHVLVVSHGGIIRYIVAVMLFGDVLTPDVGRLFFDGLATTNTGLTVCERREDQTWRLITWNDHTHLG